MCHICYLIKLGQGKRCITLGRGGGGTGMGFWETCVKLQTTVRARPDLSKPLQWNTTVSELLPPPRANTARIEIPQIPNIHISAIAGTCASLCLSVIGY